MILVYGTDLHGNHSKFKALRKAAFDNCADAIVVGADVLPKNMEPIVERQRQFLEWMVKFSKSCPCPLYFGFGNDDIAAVLPDAKEACKSSAGQLRLLAPSGTIGGVSYVHYPYVPEYPFGLKDWVKFDRPGDPRPQQYGPSVLSTPDGFEKVSDLYGVEAVEWLRARGSIEADLALVGGADLAFVHAPPAGCRLDILFDLTPIGSKSVLAWIERTQPRFSFHGHIHESYEKGGEYKADIGQTRAFQPGDRHYLVVTVPPAGSARPSEFLFPY